MRCRQEDHIDARVFHPLPREALEGEASIAGDLGISVAQVAQRTLTVARANSSSFVRLHDDGRASAPALGRSSRLHQTPRVGLVRIIYLKYSRIRFASFSAILLSGAMTVRSRPPIVPTELSPTLLHQSPLTLAVRDPALVLTTTRFCAVLTS